MHPSQLVSLLDAQPSDAVVAFDCDGTLWTGDVGEDLFEEQLHLDAFRPQAHVGMVAEAQRHGFDSSGSPRELARRLHGLEAAGKYPQERLYELMAWACAGMTRAEVRELTGRVFEKAGLRQRVQLETREVLDAARRRGLPLVAVSASTRPLIEHALEWLEVPVAAVCAATPVYEQDRMRADVLRPIPYGPGKVHNLRATLGPAPVVIALGDNAFDVDMLRLATFPVAVRPKPALRARFPEVPGIIELTRLDVRGS